MSFLAEPSREDINVEKIQKLANELIKEDAIAINEAIKLHRLSESEAEMLTELLNLKYILEAQNE